MYIYILQISKECVVGELGGRCDESQYVCICYFHSITPNKLNESKHLIEIKRRSLTTIDVADRHEVDALFIAEKYKKRMISTAREVCSLAKPSCRHARRIQPLEERDTYCCFSRGILLNRIFYCMRRFFCK